MANRETNSGIASTISSCVIWGLLPFYWKALRSIPAAEILAHRVVWASAFAAILCQVLGAWPAIARSLQQRKAKRVIVGGAMCVTLNWLTYVFAVNEGHVVQASLGYFISPLLSVFLGLVVLGERIRPARQVAIALAGFGVIAMSITFGRVPWLGLIIGGTFSLYALMRKISPLSGLHGLVVETLLLFPFAAVYLLFNNTAMGTHDVQRSLLLAASGPLTAIPLLLFTVGAKRLPMATLGMLQYITPTLQLILAVWMYNEPFTRAHQLGFGCVWLGLVMLTIESFSHRTSTKAARTATAFPLRQR